MNKLKNVAAISVSVLLVGFVFLGVTGPSQVQALAISTIEKTKRHNKFCNPDINNDSKIDALDLSILLTNWDKQDATIQDGDINSDSKVDALDLSLLLENWSQTNEN